MPKIVYEKADYRIVDKTDQRPKSDPNTKPWYVVEAYNGRTDALGVKRWEESSMGSHLGFLLLEDYLQILNESDL